jgi:uncharacterized protein YjbI with pentapeptide repeats
MERAGFRGANLSRARLDGADATGALFADAKLPEASLRGGTFFQCVFMGADLTAADCAGADLRQAMFSRAQCVGARFEGADLTYADFSHADLSAADLGGATQFRTRYHQTKLGGTQGRNALTSLGDDEPLAEAERWRPLY